MLDPSDTPAPIAAPAVADDTPAVKARVAGLTARIHELESMVRDVPALRTRLATQARESEMLRFAYRGNLSDDAMDPEVIEDAGRRYDRHVATTGDKSGTFAEFLVELAKAPPVTLRAAFAPRPGTASPTEPPSAEPAKLTPGRVNGGTIPKTGPPPSTTFSEEQVAAMTPEQVRANIGAIMAAAAAAGEISMPKAAAP
jgi:hypothetical protein